jgi:hypothetical protein
MHHHRCGGAAQTGFHQAVAIRGAEQILGRRQKNMKLAGKIYQYDGL